MMKVPDEDHMVDNVSIVSCSTQKSDVTQNLELPDLCRNKEKILGPEVYKFTSMESSKETDIRYTEGSEMSPLVPVQLNAFTQKSSSIEDSASVMSEPLIPIISTNSSTVISKPSLEVQESQSIEESQSLLPQVSAVSLTPYKHLGTENDRDHGSSGNKANIKNNSTQSNKDSLKSNTPIASGSSSNEVGASQPVAFTSGKDEFIFSQPFFPSSRKDLVTLSQLNQSGRNASEICSSQRTVTLTYPLEKDPADRIISRLDRLVSSLDKVPKRQKMVMEATIFQCITSLQDSLNSKLKKRPSAVDTAGILRKLLQTTQTGLLKLSEQHKLEKLQLSQTGTQSTQQTSSQLTQSAVSDLGKRQKRMFSLLKRQKYLVELYKTTKRTEADTSQIPVKTGQRNRKTERKLIIKSGIIKQSSNEKLDTNYSGNSGEGGTSNISHDVKTNKKFKDKIESYFENKRQNDKFKVTVVQGEQEQLRGVDTTTRETKLKRDVNFEGQFNANNIEKQAQLGDNGDSILSQDLTTVPDTQDMIQDSMLASGNDLDSDEDVVATAGSAEDMSKNGNKEFGMEITKQGTETSKKVNFERDKINAINMADSESILDKVSLKRDIGASVKTDGNVKKQKLNDIEEGIQTPESTENQSEAKLSEVLWLNMLRDDTNKGIENKKVSIDRTVEKQPTQEMFTAEKLEKGQIEINIKEPSRNDTEKVKPDFQFIKPNFAPRQNLFETENRMAQSKDQMKDDKASSEKMDKDDDINHKIMRKHFESAKGREILCSKEKEEVIVGLSSPPNVLIPGETWQNVSPTATSMSSDVFMVKVKDLQKRMKRRVEFSQSIDSDRLSSAKHLEKTDFIIGKPSGNVRDIGEDLGQTSNQKTENQDPYIGNIFKEKDTISEAIDSVIKQSREMSARNEGLRKDVETSKRKPAKVGELDTCNVNHTVSQETKFQAKSRCSQEPRPSYGQLSLNDTEDMKTGTSKQLTVGLPTLKDLIHSGQLTPGKLALSCYVKGKTHRASLTPHGKVRTPEVLMFTTASHWVSTLTDATPVKKRKAYEMVQYKGRQLLSFCVNNPGLSEPNKQPANITQDVSLTHNKVKMFTEQGTQVEDSEIPKVTTQLTEDEKRLNSLLSSCVVRLLTEQDFVACDDLPDNFWTEDFSKVRLHKDIWDTVDAW